MGNIFTKIFQNATTRILAIIFMCIFAMAVFFVMFSYYNELSIYQQQELEKLHTVTRTLATQIHGDQHQLMYEQVTQKDGIKNTNDHPVYKEFHKILRNAYLKNHLNSPLYTVVYEPSEKHFRFVVTSDEKPYYRHEWKEFHKVHLDSMQVGSVVEPYEDENGHWLSAFEPIYNSKGEVVALLQADTKFDEFIDKARYNIFKSSLITLCVIGLIAWYLVYSTKKILRQEEKLTNEVIESHKIIEQKNKDITDSIYYAKRIQEAILPHMENIQQHIRECFVLFQPRDIVSGDFYWYADSDDRIFIAAVDCTGHGVPGALMSMIGNTILTETIKAKGEKDPGKILDSLDKGINEAFNSRAGTTESRDGMDLALVAISKKFDHVEFAGAFRPLLHLRNNELVEVKANRFPIGGGSAYVKTEFTNNRLEIQPGDQLYMFSDGYPDQIGGDGSKKLMTKRFKDMLMANCHLPMKEQEQRLRKALQDWQGEHEQMDDILVIGLRIPG